MNILPSDFTLILVSVASLLGIVAYFYGKKIINWVNEYKNKIDSKTASDGRAVADKSEEDLNDQMSKLPKD